MTEQPYVTQLAALMYVHPIVLCLIAVVLGLIAHVIKSAMDARQGTGRYLKQNSQSSMLAVIGAIVGTLVALQAGETSLLAYFGIGYMANSILRNVGLPAALGGAK